MRDREADRALVAVLEKIRARATEEGRLPIDPEPRRLARELEFAWSAELDRLLDRDTWLDRFTPDELLDIACPEVPRRVIQAAENARKPDGPAIDRARSARDTLSYTARLRLSSSADDEPTREAK